MGLKRVEESLSWLKLGLALSNGSSIYGAHDKEVV